MIDKDSEVAFNRFLELEINKRIKNHKFKQPSKLKNINILKEFKLLVENSINAIKKQHSKKVIKVTTHKNYSLIIDYIWIIQEFVDNNQTKENSFILEINNVKEYFYSSGIEKVKIIIFKIKVSWLFNK